MKHCVFAMVGEEFTGYSRFLEGFYSLADMPPTTQQKIDETLNSETPALLVDIIIDRNTGNKQKHKSENERVLPKLENAGYRLSKKNSS